MIVSDPVILEATRTWRVVVFFGILLAGIPIVWGWTAGLGIFRRAVGFLFFLVLGVIVLETPGLKAQLDRNGILIRRWGMEKRIGWKEVRAARVQVPRLTFGRWHEKSKIRHQRAMILGACRANGIEPESGHLLDPLTAILAIRLRGRLTWLRLELFKEKSNANAAFLERIVRDFDNGGVRLGPLRTPRAFTAAKGVSNESRKKVQ